MTLLPTPAVNDMGAGKTVESWDEWTAKMCVTHGNGNGHGRSLHIEARRLLPTPTAANAPHQSGADGYPRRTLSETADPAMFGEYATAVACWEPIVGRPAPPPTDDGRLSPRFVEFMMGLPAGHVTDPAIGLTRAQQLKSLGNGVVPQQCAMALRMLLGMGATP